MPTCRLQYLPRAYQNLSLVPKSHPGSDIKRLVQLRLSESPLILSNQTRQTSTSPDSTFDSKREASLRSATSVASAGPSLRHRTRSRQHRPLTPHLGRPPLINRETNLVCTTAAPKLASVVVSQLHLHFFADVWTQTQVKTRLLCKAGGWFDIHFGPLGHSETSPRSLRWSSPMPI